MPYPSADALPPSVRSHLPRAAQETYRLAFNHAWRTYAGNIDREGICHRVAWAAVKNRYRKDDRGDWRAIADAVH